MVPRVVLMKSGLLSVNTARQNISKIAVLVNTARQVNVAHLKTTVNAARPMSYLSKMAHSTVKRSIHKNAAFKNSNFHQRVNTVKDNNDQGVIDSGCSRHITGNMSYLTDYEEIDGGYVAFGGNPKGGKIIGKGILRQYSKLRTPQQNGVAERRNKILIEAARTMLDLIALVVPGVEYLLLDPTLIDRIP
ncbi:putative ribonuclease H-like domain-containing protein [Tanacetum coccineum]